MLILTPATYEQFFSTPLYAEEYQMNVNIRAFDLRAVPITQNGNRIYVVETGALPEMHGWKGYVHEILLTNIEVWLKKSFQSVGGGQEVGHVILIRLDANSGDACCDSKCRWISGEVFSGKA
ncbi:hypothetical protein BC938DRAFT_483932 [Jimgerdemannia flammicorona]|uniref:Uncharacterized protein n=1 Tax=Jimgerdemannia flammicorona TaxID=994334 RepID=A0A433QVK0_9FUNG|nr:hypothetical protein BC938DRAFT_483932 [Jimgerdemannia flammicorona]